MKQVKFKQYLPDEIPGQVYDVIEDREVRLLISPVSQRDWPIRPHFTVLASDCIEVTQ